MTFVTNTDSIETQKYGCQDKRVFYCPGYYTPISGR